MWQRKINGFTAVGSGRRRLAVLLLALAMVVASCGSDTESPEDPLTPPALSADELQRIKLEAEIRRMRAETEDSTSTSAQLLKWAPFITVLIGGGTLLAAVMKQMSERRAERQREEEERRRARREDLLERERRRDEAIATTVQNMGSDSDRMRLSAAAALASSLRRMPADVTSDLLAVFVANLRNERHPDIIDVLVDNLGIALTRLHSNGKADKRLDLTRAVLRRLHAPDIDLTEADIAFALCEKADLSGCRARRIRGFQVDLTGARLSRANLHEARLNHAICMETRFHNARLVSATFKGANLIGAQFQQADLQGVHFESSPIRTTICYGTGFTGANVADAWFCNSQGNRAVLFDDSARLSLARARNWRSAHLTEADREWIEAHASDARADDVTAGNPG